MIIQKNKAFDTLSKAINEQYTKQKANNTWSGSEFENAVTLKNDYSGKAGEIFIRDLCKQLKLEHQYDEDKIDRNATYDITINGNKVEIKTARFGESTSSFQHESLRSDGCDLYAFIDILPDTIYLSVFSSNFDYNKKHPIFKRTPHLRKGTSNLYKFDFGLTSIAYGIQHGVTIEINKDTSNKEVEEFIKKVF